MEVLHPCPFQTPFSKSTVHKVTHLSCTYWMEILRIQNRILRNTCKGIISYRRLSSYTGCRMLSALTRCTSLWILKTKGHCLKQKIRPTFQVSCQVLAPLPNKISKQVVYHCLCTNAHKIIAIDTNCWFVKSLILEVTDYTLSCSQYILAVFCNTTFGNKNNIQHMLKHVKHKQDT